MSNETSRTATPAPTSPLIHVAGDIHIQFGRQDTLSMPAILPVALLSALMAGKSSAASTSESVDAATANAGDLAPRKVLADGSEVPATDPRTDHVALHFPETGWMIAVAPLSRDGRACRSQQDAEAAAKELRLLGFEDWILAPDTVYDRHVIDRRYHKPAADRSLYPNLNLDDWYWTSTLTPWSEASAFYVSLSSGNVYGYLRNGSGFGLACRRARQ